MQFKFQNILCAIDFSDFTPQVIHYGVGFANRFGARLLVFHSVPMLTDFLYGPSSGEKNREKQKRIEIAVNKINEFMGDYQVPWEPILYVGDPVENAAAAAKENNVDLVIAASHRMSTFKRFLVGTIVERMARGLTCPFLVVRPPKFVRQLDLSKSLALEKVVVTCDLTHDHQDVLSLSQYFARKFQAELHLFHTIESPAHEKVDEESLGHYGQVQEDLIARLQNRLETLIPKETAKGLNVKTVLKEGIPGESLLFYAKEQKADLVVVGIRAHGTIEKILIGSTTEAALRHSPCPVLVFTQSAAKNQVSQLQCCRSRRASEPRRKG